MKLLGFGRKKKETVVKAVDEKHLSEIMRGELGEYVKREDLRDYLEEIERDKRKKKLWESLPAQKKIQVMRYALAKKGEQHGKK